MVAKAQVSAVIPTYGRESVLVDTLRHLLALEPAPAEVLVVDQTPRHESTTEASLRKLEIEGAIRWIRLERPSIPAAMNAGLLAARFEYVLFLDDDIVPESLLVAAHVAAHERHERTLVAGRVVQPWDLGCDFVRGPHSEFSGLQGRWVDEFMGGNFSIRRSDALGLGGFDENFVRVAYRFEAEFAYRLRGSGLRIRFEPAAGLEHLKVSTGGTRSFGEHLTTWRPDHAVGAYYHALRTRGAMDCFRYFCVRPWRSIATKHHLRRPWWIPVTLVAEAFGIVWACRLALGGPRLARAASQA